MNTAKKVKLLDFKLSKNFGSQLFGMYKTTFHGKGMEFAEHREYSFGDSIKDIDWKVSARSGDIHIKKYEEERDLEVLFCIDTSSTMDFGSKKITKKAMQEEIFYSLALSALQNNDSIGAFLYTDEVIQHIHFSKNISNIFRILEAMEKNISNQKNTKNTIQLFRHLHKIHTKKKLIFVLTDDTNFTDETILKIIGKENDIIVIQIFDTFENELFAGNTHFTLNNGKKFLHINANNNEKIKAYKKLRTSQIENSKQSLLKASIGLICIDNSKNIYEEILKYFHQLKWEN